MATRPVRWVPERGEVIFINHSPNSGKEIPGEHPMLVISARAFNERTGIVIGFPVTHADFHADDPFAVQVMTKGDTRPGYVLVSQPKSFDWKQRRAKPSRIQARHTHVLVEALRRFNTICGFDANNL